MEKNEIMVCLPQETYTELLECKIKLELMKEYILADAYFGRTDVARMLGIELDKKEEK